MKYYYLYASAGPESLFLKEDGSFSAGEENIKYFDSPDEVNDKMKEVGTPARDMHGWYELDGKLLCTNVTHSCRGCEVKDAEERFDANGITTGYWCNDCYDSNKYPYRKDQYFDPGYAGESLEEDY
jgi:hypothetical protein